MGSGERGSLWGLGVMWKSQSLKWRVQKQQGEVKRAVELQEGFFVHRGAQEAGRPQSHEAEERENSDARCEAVGMIDFILPPRCFFFHVLKY